MDTKDITALFNKKEELHPDLVPFIEDSLFGKSLKHPLVFSLFYDEGMNAFINAQYETKKKVVSEVLVAEKFPSFIWFHERPYRFFAFKQIKHLLNDQQYWAMLGSIWIDSENLWQQKKYLQELFFPEDREWDKRYHLMDDEDKKMLDTLPKKVVIYRGCSVLNKRGYSWTLDRDKAIWFAKRFYNKKHEPLLLTGNVKKSSILAYFSCRQESEIVVPPKSVRILKEESAI